VLQAALQAPAPQTRLAVLLVVTTAISSGYYLQVLRVMYMKPRPANAPATAPAGGFTRLVIAGSAALIVLLGLFPDAVARLAQRGAAQPPSPQTAAAETNATSPALSGR